MKPTVIFIFSLFLISCSAYPTQILVKEHIKKPLVYFCPIDPCDEIIVHYINQSNSSIHCAFFDIDLENILDILSEKSKIIDVKLLIDNNNIQKNLYGKGLAIDTSSQLSHNKFCIFDNKIILTGSFNPTKSEIDNNNNIMIIESENLVVNYESEFNELFNNNFGKGRKTANPIIYINNKRYENYFCPDDSCQEKVLEELEKAEENIYFMTFSFTDNKISRLLVDKKKANLDIKGVFESSRFNMQYEQYRYLQDNNIKLAPDNKPVTMHHKVFIIDNRTVITGSYNPTQAANEKNDENILIIKDKAIAEKFLQEFNRLFVTNQK